MIKLYLDSLTQVPTHEQTYSLILLVTIIVSLFLQSLLRSASSLTTTVFGLIQRKALTSLLYKKLLKLPVSRVASATSGRLITLASGDMVLIEGGGQALGYVIDAPLFTIFSLFVLYHVVSTLNQIDRKHDILLCGYFSRFLLSSFAT